MFELRQILMGGEVLASWRDTYYTNRRQSRYAEKYKDNEVISAQWEQMEWNQSCYLALGTSKGRVDVYNWWQESELDWDRPIFEYKDKDQFNQWLKSTSSGT